MSPTRRHFLAVTAAGAGLAVLRRSAVAHPLVPSPEPAPMTILMLGGTAFLGPRVVEAALARGHTVTLFNRGRTNPHLFPDLEKLRGDRDPDVGEGLSALKGRTWDAVVDTWADHPRFVRDSTRLLGPSVRQYLYVSTIAVYQRYDRAPVTEDQPIRSPTEIPEDPGARLPYPARKRLAEIAAEGEIPGRLTIIRPGSICGRELDYHSDNQRYWPVRIDRGGEVLAPGDGLDPVQYIDVLDVARWTIIALEEGHTGVYNTVSPLGAMTFAEYLHGAKAITSSGTRFMWVSSDFLREQNVEPFDQMPMWIPRPMDPGFFSIDSGRAIARGLTFRPHADSMRDILEGFKAREPADYKFGVPPATCISAEREGQLLHAWHAR